jgi:hypothetical protein
LQAANNRRKQIKSNQINIIIQQYDRKNNEERCKLPSQRGAALDSVRLCYTHTKLMLGVTQERFFSLTESACRVGHVNKGFYLLLFDFFFSQQQLFCL